MTITISSRFGLNTWEADGDAIQRSQFNTNFDQLESLAAQDLNGTFSARPQPGISGRYYFANDLGRLYRDSGNNWAEVLCHVDYVGTASARPNPGNSGTYYYESDQDRLFRDNGSQWIEILTSTLLPAGSVTMTVATVAPTGWLMCDGTAYATSLYPVLFSVIGYRFGGAGSNFNVPNLRNLFPVGAPNAGAVGGTGTFGLHQHPSHTHQVQGAIHTHVFAATTTTYNLDTQEPISGPDTQLTVNGWPGSVSQPAADGPAGPFGTYFYANYAIKAS